MLIIAIMLFVRKKTKLRIAYAVLTLTGFSVVAYDATVRNELQIQNARAPRTQSARPAAPLPITPLAQSPFPEARPESVFHRDVAIAHSEEAPAPMRERNFEPSAVCFLTVAVKVDTGTRPVALSRGTRVQLVREQDGKFLVRRNGTDFLIEKSHITDDVRTLALHTRTSS